MDTTKLNQLVSVTDAFAKKTKLAEQAISTAKYHQERYEYLQYAVDQYKKYGHLTCEEGKKRGATWFGDFTVTRDIVDAGPRARYYNINKFTALREYLMSKQDLIDQISIIRTEQ
jgi:hypothetical protein